MSIPKKQSNFAVAEQHEAASWMFLVKKKKSRPTNTRAPMQQEKHEHFSYVIYA